MRLYSMRLLVRKIYSLVIVVGAVFAVCSDSVAQELTTHPQQKNVSEEILKKIGAKIYTRDVGAEREFVGTFEFPVEQDADSIDQSLVSNYWIGVQCEKAGQTSYSPKELPDTELVVEGGMKILAVTEGSASDEAGFAEGDVLIKFAGKDMGSLNDLYAVIGETQNNEAKAVVVRGKELRMLAITPQERPVQSLSVENNPLTNVQDAFHSELLGKRLPIGYRMHVELANGKEIKLKFERGDEAWQANAGSINELPEDVQTVASEIVAHCKPMVENSSISLHWHLPPNNGQALFQANNVLPLWAFQARQSTGQKLESIEGQLDALTKAIEDLRSELQND